MTEIFIILGLILINGFFSMAEIALVSARKARLEAQADKGDQDAKRALKLANHPDTFLSTIQIGITLVGVLTGIYSGGTFKEPLSNWLFQFAIITPYAETIATLIIVILLTYVSLVLGELVPKRIGLSNPEGIAKTVSRLMQLFSVITHPFTWFLSASSHLIMRILRMKPNDNQVTEEEIKAIISEGTEQGTIEEAEQEIIERVFHLSDRNITSLMTHRSDILWLESTKTVGDIRANMPQGLHSMYPVCEGSIDQIKGVVSLKDLFVADGAQLVSAVAKEAKYVPENNSAYQVLENFKQSKIHHCFIVNEYGSIEGLITLNDILEAIVGDIPQQEDHDYEILKRADGTYLIDAQLPFYDFLSYFDKTEFMLQGDQEFDTLAGFIIHSLEKIPTTGEMLVWKTFTFEIVDMDQHRIDKILVTLTEED
jgi:putative hemolysin